MSLLLEALRPRLRQLPPAPRHLVALSGGADSLALLHGLAELRAEFGLRLLALHVDHGLQAQSAAWAEQCQQACAELDLECRCLPLRLEPAPGESLEAQARQARYAALQGQMRAGDLLLTGHHQDDQAETLLLQLLRGSGLPGLAAMPWLRPFGPGWLARPLLDVPRQALLNALRQRGRDWIHDPSNGSLAFDRNFLRHQIMPLLSQRWPAAARCLSRSAAHCAEAQELLQQLAQTVLGPLCPSPDQLELAAFAAKPLIERHWLMRSWLQGLGAPSPNSAQLQRLCVELVEAAEDRQPLVRWAGVEVRRYRHRLYYLNAIQTQPWHPGPLPWPEPLDLALPGNGYLRLRWTQGGLDPALWRQQRLEVRYRQGGEHCPSRHKSVKKLLQEAASLPWQRQRLPLLFANGRLIAIANLGLCDASLGHGQGLALDWEWG
jgi:tRNA(Ile)-lysidine synthase